MFFIDKPYVSDFFKATVKDNGIPIVGTAIAKSLDLYSGTKIITEEEAIEIAKEQKNLRIYTTSENAIGWIAEHFSFCNLPEKIELFKNKVHFREMTKSIFPDFYFKEIPVEELQNIKIEDIPLPVIIKPTVGFFSMGVYKLSSFSEWDEILQLMLAEIEQVKGLYPEKVLDTGSFIIEQCIDGEEFAVDAYYNEAGEAIVLSIYHHIFSSDTDVSDRVYTTSKEIMESNLDEFTGFVDRIGVVSGVKNFPVHIELRREGDGTLLPIEVNPMRFGGWCTTADTTFKAYGLNPYLYYYYQQKPDWPALLKGKEEKLFSLIVLDNSTGITGKDIASFDYEELLATFEKPLELRRIDFKKYPVFGFLFVETQENNFAELKKILDSDLNEFITIK
jgi:hypothetical protein